MKRGFLNKVKKTTNPSERELLVATPIQPAQATSINSDTLYATELNSLKALIRDSQNNSGLLLVVAKFPEPSPLRPNEPVTTALLYSGTKEALYSIPGFLDPLPSLLRTEWPFVIKDAPNSGKGLFAQETISTGNLIFTERPLVLRPVALPYIPGQTLHPDDVFKQAFERMNPGDQQELLGLHNCKGASVPLLRGIMNTNSLIVGALPGPFTGMHGAVGRIVSRINHSCTPNARYYFDMRTISIYLIPLRTVKKGEQIFISYTDSLASREERQSNLLQKYSFTCNCSSCSLPKEESKRSDLRRSLISAAFKQFNFTNINITVRDWAYDLSLPNDYLTKPNLRIMDLMTEEGIFDVSATWYCGVLSVTYCALGDRQAAIRWAKKCAVWNTTFLKDNGGETDSWVEFSRAPEKSPLWGFRLRKMAFGAGKAKASS